MKKIVEKEIAFCDICETDINVYYECDICGKHVCYEHKGHVVQFGHSVWCSGSGDGTYCNECLAENKNDSLILAYRVIQNLRDESKEWNAAFEVRAKSAEEYIKTLRKKNND